MMIKENSNKIKIEGYRGTWYVIKKFEVVDMNKKSRIVYALESENWGEDVPPLFTNNKGQVFEDFEGYYMIDDIINDFKDNEFTNEFTNIKSKS